MVLTAFYDLAVGPVSFDFIPFLIRARMAQEDAKAKRLHVVIVPHEKGIAGMFRNKLKHYDEQEMSWRLWNIVMPACRLTDASVTLATDWDQAKCLGKKRWPEDFDKQTLLKKPYLWDAIVRASRAGRKIPKLRASEHARRKVSAYYRSFGRPVATLTMRNTYEAQRNSDSSVWTEMRNRLDRDYATVLIRDTSDALELGHAYAEVNLDLRLACYELAKINLHAHGGCAQLCWFSEAPFLMFEAGMPFESWAAFWKSSGIDVTKKEQLPWARENQTLVYEKASVTALERALWG